MNRKYKYTYWLKIDLTNETKEGKEWINLKKYRDTYDCQMAVFYYDYNFTSKVIKLDCNQSYEDLDLDVNSLSVGSLIKLQNKPKNITQYKKDIDYFFDLNIKTEQSKDYSMEL